MITILWPFWKYWVNKNSCQKLIKKQLLSQPDWGLKSDSSVSVNFIEKLDLDQIVQLWCSESQSFSCLLSSSWHVFTNFQNTNLQIFFSFKISIKKNNCPHNKYRQFFQPNLEDRKEIEICFVNFRPLKIVLQKNYIFNTQYYVFQKWFWEKLISNEFWKKKS